MVDKFLKNVLNEACVTYMGQKARVGCDRKCFKAWGINSRPRHEDGISEGIYLQDHELGNAPNDPGTIECEYKKPLSPDEFPNRWCVRECERCAISNPGEWMNSIELIKFD